MNEVIKGSYQIVEERTLDLIASEIKLIEQHTAQAILAGAVGIGTRLKEAKEKCPHGEWEKWCEEHLQYTARWASQLMRISDEYGDKNSPYFKAISKTNTSSDLSVSNALRLLAVPAEEVENFVEEHPDIGDMKVKELESEIKELKEKLKAEEEQSKEEIDDLKANNEILSEEITNLTEKLSEIPKGDSASSELADELEELKEAYEKAMKEIEDLQSSNTLHTEVVEKDLKAKLEKFKANNEELKNKLKAAKEEKEKEIKEKVEEVKTEIFAEAEAAAKAEKEEMEEKLAKLQRELKQSSNSFIATHKAKLGVMQSTFEDILRNLKAAPDEERSRLTIGLHKFLASLDTILGEAESER